MYGKRDRQRKRERDTDEREREREVEGKERKGCIRENGANRQTYTLKKREKGRIGSRRE